MNVKVKLKVGHLYNGVTSLQLYRVEGVHVRTADSAAHTMAYDNLAPSHPLLQLVYPSTVPAAAQRTLTPSRSWY